MDYFQGVEDLSAGSKAFYNNRLNLLAQEAKTTDLRTLYAQPEHTIRIIRNYLTRSDSYTAASLNSFIKALMSYRRHHLELFSETVNHQVMWNKLIHATHDQANAYREENKPSPSQQQKTGIHLTMEEIEKIRDGLDIHDPARLLIAFYTMIPPLRADLGECEVLAFGDVPTSHNYVFLDGNRAVMNIGDYKLASVNGPIRAVLPEPLRMLLSASLAHQPRKYLFERTKGTPYTRALFSPWANKTLSRVFGCEFTLTLFRHIYISSLPKKQMTIKELERVAYLMGHSRDQQELYRWV